MEWTQEKVEFLRTHNSEPIHVLMSALDCTKSSIGDARRRYKLRLYKWWSEKDDQFLLEHYNDMSYREIGKALGKSGDTVQKRARKLGLYKEHYGSKRWSAEELEYLKNHIFGMDMGDIANYLNRTRRAVIEKAREYGYVDERRWTKEEINYVLQHKEESLKDLSKALNRSANSVQKKRKKLMKIKKVARWTDKDVEYLKKALDMGKTIAFIARRLRRTKSSISSKKSKLGLEGCYSEYMRLGSLLKILFRSPKANTSSYKWARRNGLPIIEKDKNILLVDIQEFWEWAKNNQDKINLAKVEPYELGYEPEWAEKKRNTDRLKEAEERWAKC